MCMPGPTDTCYTSGLSLQHARRGRARRHGRIRTHESAQHRTSPELAHRSLPEGWTDALWKHTAAHASNSNCSSRTSVQETCAASKAPPQACISGLQLVGPDGVGYLFAVRHWQRQGYRDTREQHPQAPAFHDHVFAGGYELLQQSRQPG